MVCNTILCYKFYITVRNRNKRRVYKKIGHFAIIIFYNNTIGLTSINALNTLKLYIFLTKALHWQHLYKIINLKKKLL